MIDPLELVNIYDRIKGNKDDFLAIGLYQNLADEETLGFYYVLINQVRYGYIEDETRG